MDLALNNIRRLIGYKPTNKPTSLINSDCIMCIFVNIPIYTRLYGIFSFFLTGCHTKYNGPTLFFYLPIAGGRIIEFVPIFQGYYRYVKYKQSHPGLNSGHRLHFLLYERLHIFICTYLCILNGKTDFVTQKTLWLTLKLA